MSRPNRGVGLSAFSARSNLSSSYATHGAALRSSNVDSLQTQLSVFQSLLHNFAVQYAPTIRANPTFRAEFARMCNAIGVDPLASSSNARKKGTGSKWWSALGVGGSGVGDFYFDVAVRVVQICRETRGANGGLLGVDECRASLKQGRGILGGAIDVSEDDVRRAVEALRPLGAGFAIVEIGRKAMIRSVPKELSTDQATVLEAIQVMGFVTVAMLEDNLSWDRARAQTVVEDLLADSLVWLDAKGREKEYWSPSFLSSSDE